MGLKHPKVNRVRLSERCKTKHIGEYYNAV